MKRSGPVVYLIHFETRYKHALHYTGWTTSLAYRLQHHRNGTGSRLMAAVQRAGIRWAVVKTTPGTRTDERVLKNRRNTRRTECPVCRGVAFVCWDCGRVYRYAGWLDRHQRLVHGSHTMQGLCDVSSKQKGGDLWASGVQPAVQPHQMGLQTP